MNEWTHKHQLEIKEHINEIAGKRKDEARTLYEKKKEGFVRHHIDRKKKEISKALEPLIKKFQQAIKNLEGRAEKINYNLGYPEFEYKIPEIESSKIESALEKDFDSKNENKLNEAIKEIEQKQLQGEEKVLFCDAKEQQQIIKELREMKIEL